MDLIGGQTTDARKLLAPLEQMRHVDLGWARNEAARKLLDVVIGIIAEEFVDAVKKNPEVFASIPGENKE